MKQFQVIAGVRIGPYRLTKPIAAFYALDSNAALHAAAGLLSAGTFGVRQVWVSPRQDEREDSYEFPN